MVYLLASSVIDSAGADPGGGAPGARPPKSPGSAPAVSSSPDRFKPKSITFVFFASPLSMHH